MAFLGNNIDTDEHFLYLENLSKKIANSNIRLDQEKYINAAYNYAKEITPLYFNEHRLLPGYKFIKHGLLTCEDMLLLDYIMESSPNYKRELIDPKISASAPIEDKLKYIVYMTRKYLEQEVYRMTKGAIPFEQADLGDYCKKASTIINRLCYNLGLRYRQVIINPGFTEYPQLYDGNGYHYINMVIYGDKKYIIDTTYRQFFTTRFNNLNRIGIVEISNCHPGVFMSLTPERKKLAYEILKNGWFEATPENLKRYFDGFAISYRNGLYYQEKNDYSYTTNYTSEDYMNFINGHDNQVNHEGEELLGFQRSLTPKK